MTRTITTILLTVLTAMILGAVPSLALCMQEAPFDCPFYTAVACDPEATGGQAIATAQWAIARVWDENDQILDEQTVDCSELEEPEEDPIECEEGDHGES